MPPPLPSLPSLPSLPCESSPAEPTPLIFGKDPRPLVDDLLTAHALQGELVVASMTGDSNLARSLLAQGADPAYYKFRALTLAASYGHIECVNLLASGCGPEGRSLALVHAAANGNAECVKNLMATSSPHHCKGQELIYACRNGKFECVLLLLPWSAIAQHADEIFAAAANQNDPRIVAALFDSGVDLLCSADICSFQAQALAAECPDSAAAIGAHLEQKRLRSEFPPCLSKKKTPGSGRL